uniref:Uncharacterized protein n=1 Tax=Roseihalotalea indica TaxID=2867963 RepID=A0AA49PYX5_9BACT|nr:hypothetical protein K4G66_14355 [Tunicatimonas sp. TK19036]
MKYYYLFFFCFFAQSTWATALPQYGFWCSGRITLENNEVLEGEISYDLKFDAIQIKKGGIVRTYTAQNINSFEMFDPIKYRHRKYVSIDHAMGEGYKRKTFFEVLADGKLTVLRKSKYVRRPRVTEDFRAPHIYLNVVCRHTYYIYKEGEFMEVDDFQGQVLPLMRSHQREIADYVQRCDLKLREIHEQMRVVNLYNQLVAIGPADELLTESVGK